VGGAVVQFSGFRSFSCLFVFFVCGVTLQYSSGYWGIWLLGVLEDQLGLLLRSSSAFFRSPLCLCVVSHSITCI
jgi:hypothetical protein